MADELSVNIQARLSLSPLLEMITPGQITVDVAATGLAAGIQNIGTSEETITTTEVGTLGWAFFQNLDSTNFVKIGADSGGSLVPFVKLKAGEYCILRLMTGITIKAQADTAACELLYKIFEN